MLLQVTPCPESRFEAWFGSWFGAFVVVRSSVYEIEVGKANCRGSL
jgi:hypothetical protein